MASSISSWVDETNEQEQSLAKEVSNLDIKKDGTEPAAGEADKAAGDAPATTTEVAKPEEEISIAEKSLLQKIIRKGLKETSAKLEIIQKDPTSPLYSAHSFEELNLRPELLKGVYAMGFNAPSRIQESALPILLSNPPQNLIAQSQSGTGKTAAFVLAMLSRVDTSMQEPQILCLSPTFELAVQTGEVIEKMGQYCPEIEVVFAIRGNDINDKVKAHIIIGTPGKIMDWAFRHRFFDISKIRVFVLDEADVMIATQGYRDQSIKLRKRLPNNCQMMLFSATYDTEVMEFAETIVPNATILKLKKEEESLDNIKQYYIECSTPDEKYRAISNIYGAISVGKAMIFCQHRSTAWSLAERLNKDGHAVAILYGDLTVDQRIAVLNRFREGTERVLVTTNVMARGIDVDQVNLVVNFDMPLDANKRPDCETYLHRIGRTGRFGRSGIAINLVDGNRSMNALRDIEAHFGRPIVKLDPDNIVELEQLED